MHLFSYFSKAERMKRRRQKAEKAMQQRKQQIQSLLNHLSHPNDISIGMFTVRALQLEELCGWPPPSEFLGVYAKSLGFQALAYLWLAEHVHHRQYYPGTSFAPTAYILTWRRAAQKSGQLVRRLNYLLQKASIEQTDIIADISASLKSIEERALVARNRDFEEAVRLPSYSQNNIEQSSISGMPWGPLGRRRSLPPEIIGAFVSAEGGREIDIQDTGIPHMLQNPQLGQWLTKNLDCLKKCDPWSSIVVFADMPLIYADDPSDSRQLQIDPAVKQKPETAWPISRELPEIYGLLVRAEAPLGEYLEFGVNADGQLPISKQHHVTLDEKTGPLVTLYVAQGPIDCNPRVADNHLAILQVHPSVSNKAGIVIEVDFDVSSTGKLSVTAREKASKLECNVINVI